MEPSGWQRCSRKNNLRRKYAEFILRKESYTFVDYKDDRNISINGMVIIEID